MSTRGEGGAVASGASRRIDQWLWYARVVKSRTMAAGLVAEGRVRINRERVEKPSHILKIGDVVTVTAHERVRVLKVAAAGIRRGPPIEAAALFEDLTPPPVPVSAEDKVAAGQGAREAGSGRPTKRDRRTLDRFQRSGDED